MPTEVPTPVPAGGGSGRIYFISVNRDEGVPGGLYAMDADGSNVEAIDAGFPLVLHPDFSPDGSQIAYWTPLTGDEMIFVIDAEGTGGGPADPVTNFSSAVPDWSPDGTRLLFNSDHDDEPKDTPDLWAMNLDGSDLVEIIDNPPDADYAAQWSPDGTQILFVSDRTGSRDLFVANIDGSEVTQITDDPASEVDAVWSPDGSQIAFVSNRSGDSEIFVMNADGSDVTQITDDDYDELEIDWSPDGSRIVFVKHLPDQYDIFTINPDGSDEVQVTDDAFEDHTPIWQP